ncbi:FAD-dependent oxidoreductase [Desulfovibrio ferrophilus]|uniref:Thioredoxin reductase n=1 Tax=Desulfovibrio ferrophilus TaxID=241368 RepID=A0A2Z6B0K0_9BACT|nr:FAD-dependent oxidoreductase [Desulfovibrio ferrophilus]BBD09057.1 thioredoxin reductase [Desulfovibrio ferrophilus]
MSDETKKNGEEQWYLPEDSRTHLEKLFKDMPEPVTLEVFTQPGVNDPYNEAMEMFMRDIDRLGEKITVNFNDLESEKASKYGVSLSPSLLVQPEKYRIRYTGTPLGEEARVFIETMMLISHGKSGLSQSSQDVLAGLSEEREIKVFISPTCPYCPGQVSQVMRAAIERPDLISAECVETVENQALADEYQAQSVPLTVTNESFRQKGLLPEERFVLEMVYLKHAEELLEEMQKNDPDAPDQAATRAMAEDVTPAGEYDVVVAGAGPAGLTAAIYTERSGLKTLVLEKGVVGGQVILTPEVENYPGFKMVGGIKLMEMISAQARDYCDIHEGEGLDEIKIGKKVEIITAKGRYLAKSLVLATGASAKLLGVPGEAQLFGRGVSVCASCDGWAYKGKHVIMVGGGNTALTEALHLKNMDVEVTLVHRRDEFRAEKHLQNGIRDAGIEVIWDTEVKEFVGDETGLHGVRLKNVKTEETSELKVDGAFLAIGWNPNTEIPEQVGVTLDEWGYIKVDRNMRTNIPRIYACGDVIGGVQQIATAVGEGSTAALAVFEDLSNPYWKRAD